VKHTYQLQGLHRERPAIAHQELYLPDAKAIDCIAIRV
jgi:hypothetical protein